VSALVDVLGALAAAKHGLGYRLAFAALSAPTIEAAVATVALAQEELGHARLLYASELRVREGRSDDEGVVGAATPTAPPVPDLVPPPVDWPEVLATLATLDVGLSLWLETLAEHAEPWLRSRAQRMLDEESFHREYLRGWLDVVAREPALHRRVRAAVTSALARYGPWLDELASRGSATGVVMPPAAPQLHATVAELMAAAPVQRRDNAESIP
jgi:ring-1,2-phenylacetyl-CoA epoxidase subunit PaaC